MIPKISIIADPEKAWIQGRNGLYPIIEIYIWGEEDNIFLDGISRKGAAINGGFGGLDAKQIDEFAQAWIKMRCLIG